MEKSAGNNKLPSLDELGNCFQIKVTPKASANIIKVAKLADSSFEIKVYITAAPEDGKANQEVVKLLAKTFKIPKSSITISKGSKSRIKTIEIQLD